MAFINWERNKRSEIVKETTTKKSLFFFNCDLYQNKARKLDLEPFFKFKQKKSLYH